MAPPFSPGDQIKITIYEGPNDTAWRWGEFIKLDETGLLFQPRVTRNIAFVPRERLVMIESA